MEVCKSSKESDPLFPSQHEKGLYCEVDLEEENSNVCAAYQVLAETECSAPKLWIDKLGEVMKIEAATHSEAFVNDVNDSVIEQVNMENFWNRETVHFNLEDTESTRISKQGGFFSSLDIMDQVGLSKDSSGAQDIKTPYALLDKKRNTKELKHCSLRKESPVKIFSSTFLEEDKISARKSLEKASGKCKTNEKDIEPIAKIKESISDVFEFKDDPYVLEIQARKKKETEKLMARTKVKTRGRKRKSMTRMAQFSKSLAGSQSLDGCSQESSSDETIKFETPKKKSMKRKNEDVPKEKNSTDELLEEATDYTPSIDELLKRPDRPEDGGKTIDEILDDIDIEIAERRKKHEEEMFMIDLDITAEKQRQEDRRERMKQNAALRDRLEVEINEVVLRRMFKENTEYLRNIEAGKVESERHRAFHKSCRTRHALFYTMITDPFSDCQLKWTLEEMEKVWMRNTREQMENNEYVWKVLLPECFIKFYMDHFNIDKKEAEKRIGETPLGEALEDSEEDEL